MIFLLIANGLSPGGSITVHIYTQTIHRTTQITTQVTNLEECGPCPVFVNFTLAFALQLRKKHGKPSVRVRKTVHSDFPTKTLYAFLMSPIRVSYPAAHPITLSLTKAHVIKFQPCVTSRQHPQPPPAQRVSTAANVSLFYDISINCTSPIIRHYPCGQ